MRAREFGEPGDPFAEGRRPGVGVDPDHRPPDLDLHRLESEAGRVEVELGLGARGAVKAPVEVVRPAVVQALHRAPVPRLVHDGVGAVPADVHEATDLALQVPDEHDGNSADLAEDLISDLGQLSGVAGELPGAPEDPVALLLVDRGIGVPASGQRIARLESLDCVLVGRSGVLQHGSPLGPHPISLHT